LALALAGTIGAGHAEEQATADAKLPAPTVLTSKDALKTMRGMAGYYRATPTGDVYLYPRMTLAAEMYGMYGSYEITPEGILLRPGGKDGITMGESAMGGASGSFRITPSGQAYFYTHESQPPGMGGTSGQGTE
jgi:hypothetical protein